MNKTECQAMMKEIENGLYAIPNIEIVDYVTVGENGEVYAGVDVRDGLPEKEEQETLILVSDVILQVQVDHGVKERK